MVTNKSFEKSDYLATRENLPLVGDSFTDDLIERRATSSIGDSDLDLSGGGNWCVRKSDRRPFGRDSNAVKNPFEMDFKKFR